MKQNDSETTTSPTEPSQATGTLGGADGSAMLPASAETEVQLSQLSPNAVDEVAVSRVRQLGVDLHVESRWISPAKGQSYEVVIKCLALGEGNYEVAQLEIERLLTPAAEAEIESFLAELSVIAARKPASDFEEEIRLTAYTRRLQAYPADVVRFAVLEHPWRFWPSWAELDEVCRLLAAPRRIMLEALKHGEYPPRRLSEAASARDRQNPEQRDIERKNRPQVCAEVEEVIASFRGKLIARGEWIGPSPAARLQEAHRSADPGTPPADGAPGQREVEVEGAPSAAINSTEGSF